jgi:carbonic anhydrase/acetyltransferase-like protein (isoleucine patch superfamily)
MTVQQNGQVSPEMARSIPFKGAQVEDNAMIKATTILAGAALLGVTFLLAPVPAANATPTRSVERAATLQLSAQYHHYNHRHHHCWWSHGHRHCVWR